MKQLLFAFIMLAPNLTKIQGQTIAHTNNNSSAAQIQSCALFNEKDNKFHFSTETKVGFGIAGVGLIMGGVGITTYHSSANNDSYSRQQYNERTGAAMWLVGGVLVILGSVLSIDGGIHDMRRYHHAHRITMSSVKGNEVGIAYSF